MLKIVRIYFNEFIRFVYHKNQKAMTTQEIIEMPSNKIRSISTKVGLSNSMLLKVMKEKNEIIVVTRQGLLKYMGNAQYAYYSGKKGVDFKSFKDASKASKFINSILN